MNKRALLLAGLVMLLAIGAWATVKEVLMQGLNNGLPYDVLGHGLLGTPTPTPTPTATPTPTPTPTPYPVYFKDSIHSPVSPFLTTNRRFVWTADDIVSAPLFRGAFTGTVTTATALAHKLTFGTGLTGTPDSTFDGSAAESVALTNPVLVALGGTGLASWTQGDLPYFNSGTALSKLAKDANATRYLSNQGTSNNPSWNQVGLSDGVTGTLADGNLSSNVALKNIDNNFSTTQTMIGLIVNPGGVAPTAGKVWTARGTGGQGYWGTLSTAIYALLSGVSPISFNSSTGAFSFLTNTDITWTGHHTWTPASGTPITINGAASATALRVDAGASGTGILANANGSGTYGVFAQGTTGEIGAYTRGILYGTGLLAESASGFALKVQNGSAAQKASIDFAGTMKTSDTLYAQALTASRAVVTGVSKQLASSAATATEVGYLSGVTSAIQTQLAAPTATATQWKDFSSASCGFVGNTSLASGGTGWISDGVKLTDNHSDDVSYYLMAVPYEAGSVITQIRVKWASTSADNNGVKFRILKRLDSTNAATAWTVVGAQQTANAAGPLVTVTTYNVADETMAANTSYAIEVLPYDPGGDNTEIALYSIGIETSQRIL